ncbi:MAG: hypothetical protein PHI35_04080, partial [Victivallaceae bacterium]|nr:hypothetical protein [Victivallaceae bacterium]
RAAVDALLAGVWCVVSATGIKDALTGEFDMVKLIASPALIANMGVEDEYGAAMPSERVLNQKKPLNFMLGEPTHLKYIDPTMALSNYGAWKLVTAKDGLPGGIIRPTDMEEEAIFESIRKYGVIRDELEEFFK